MATAVVVRVFQLAGEVVKIQIHVVDGRAGGRADNHVPVTGIERAVLRVMALTALRIEV